jgi:hypothetical protein
MVSPSTASPAPSTSLSSSSPRLILDLGRGRDIGLANDIVARNVGLDEMQIGRDNVNPEVGKEQPIVGEEAAELTVEPGMVMGMGIGRLGVPFDGRETKIGDMRDWCDSRR